jgi:hypothetical protein
VVEHPELFPERVTQVHGGTQGLREGAPRPPYTERTLYPTGTPRQPAYPPTGFGIGVLDRTPLKVIVETAPEHWGCRDRDPSWRFPGPPLLCMREDGTQGVHTHDTRLREVPKKENSPHNFKENHTILKRTRPRERAFRRVVSCQTRNPVFWGHVW